MKNSIVLLCILLLVAFSSCLHGKDDINISVSESGTLLKFSARFPKDKTTKVEKIMAENLSPNTIMTGGTKDIDATITLDDKTNFHMKSEPGDLNIEFDRYKNTKSSYERIRNTCEEIKTGLTK